MEMLNAPGVEPKMRKSALVQISVMLTDSSLLNVFIGENGLQLILKIFNSALVPYLFFSQCLLYVVTFSFQYSIPFQIEQEYANYPDSVIPILTILKLICSTDSSVRHELSVRSDIYLNILRSNYLFR